MIGRVGPSYTPSFELVRDSGVDFVFELFSPSAGLILLSVSLIDPISMAARPPHNRSIDHNQSAPSHSPASSSSPDSTTVNGLPHLRTRPIIVDHSLASQWKGTSGRVVHESAYITDRQRLILLVLLFLIGTIFILSTFYFSHPRTIHPNANLSHDDVRNNPHMLRQFNKLMSAANITTSGSTVSTAANGVVGVASSPYSVLYVTAPSQEVAHKISSGLLEAHLIACANIIPTMTSMYHWEGKVQSETEILLMLKTRSSLFEQVSSFIKLNHPYQVPEIIQLPIQQGSKDYLQWINENTKDPLE